MIREITPEDNYKMGEVVQENLEQHSLEGYAPSYYDPNTFQLSIQYTQIGGKYWVYEEEGEIIGGVGISPFRTDKNMCELQKLYVKKEHQNKGVGDALMETALKYAERNYQTCYIETYSNLGAANHLYEKHSFTKLSEPLFDVDAAVEEDTFYLKEF